MEENKSDRISRMIERIEKITTIQCMIGNEIRFGSLDSMKKIDQRIEEICEANGIATESSIISSCYSTYIIHCEVCKIVPVSGYGMDETIITRADAKAQRCYVKLTRKEWLNLLGLIDADDAKKANVEQACEKIREQIKYEEGDFYYG